MSTSPVHQREGGRRRTGSLQEPLSNLSSRILQQKRIEHEQMRQDHFKRLEGGIDSLSIKESHAEDDIVHQSSTVSSLGLPPATPMKTPVHVDARLRASSVNHITPTAKAAFESLSSTNGQLATPPSEKHMRLNLPRSSAKSIATSLKPNVGSEIYRGPEYDCFGALNGYGCADTELNPGVTLRPYRTITSACPRELQVEPTTGRQKICSGYRMLPEHDRTTVRVQYIELTLDSSQFYLQAQHTNPDDPKFPTLSLVRKDNDGEPVIKHDVSSEFRRAPEHDERGSQHGAHMRGSSIQENPYMKHENKSAVPRPPGLLPHGDFDSQYGAKKAYQDLYSRPAKSPLGTLPNLTSPYYAQNLGQGLYNPYGVQPVFSNPSYNSFPLYGADHTYDQGMHPRFPSGVFGAPRPTRRLADDPNRFTDVPLDSLRGELYSLCKDQHGCRYLQKKLDERNPVNADLIFAETHMHAAELMIDPFGNYLCQKLFEHCNDAQKFKIVQIVAPDLVNIALNMHGTRAVQKMIEHLHTPEQIKLTIAALKRNCVDLIKDLNGNHVIQRCLTKWTQEDNWFIMDTASGFCLEIACHRHGCCVMQRCIDHASDKQRRQIIDAVIAERHRIVQDPFGNYVIQYILDLNDADVCRRLMATFKTFVCFYAVQKFSSNVIEKCLRVAEPAPRGLLIEEMLECKKLPFLLKDCYANYVIQTALDYAEPGQRERLVEAIKPLLPAIRSTPYGRRIQSKLSGAAFDPCVPHYANALSPLNIGDFATFRNDYE